MKLWNRKKKIEKRQTLEEILINGQLLTDAITKEQALNIPSVSACVDLICNTVASLPICLYKEKAAKTKMVKDYRIALLNDDTLDTLNGLEWKRALIEDYLLSGAGYSYINWRGNKIKSLNYVRNDRIGVTSNTDPIFKKYQILVDGMPYRDWEFVKMTRKSLDGVTGRGIIEENNKMLSVAYNTVIYEETVLKTGGSKKGFLKAQGRLSKEAILELKTAWANLYKNNTSDIVILNNGLEFEEASQTSVELQMDEHKKTNAEEICKLFLVPPNILSGDASDEEYNNWIKICISPILSAFECALNKDLLLPSEKESFYFAFDTKLLLRGDIEKRYAAYQIGINSGILQWDEARYMEDLPPLGLDFIKLGLQDVLYDIKNKTIFVPNTNKLAKMGENIATEPNNPSVDNAINNGPGDPNNANNSSTSETKMN